MDEERIIPELVPKPSGAIELLTPQEKLMLQARRTAFVARFIVLRESKRTRAHRVIEKMEWHELTDIDVLADRFRSAFQDNGDNMAPVERDIRRALSHAARSLNHFFKQYVNRSTSSFIEALFDYERSNELLFGEDESPRQGGWRHPEQLKKEIAKEAE